MSVVSTALPGHDLRRPRSCSLANGTLNTSTFSNVQITGGNGGAPVVTPAAPVALVASPGEGVVPLRWQSSFGATSYTVKRATSSGGPYSTIASGITTSSYTDTTVTNGTTFTTSSRQAIRRHEWQFTRGQREAAYPLVNVTFGGTPSASANGSSSTEGAALAFDGTTGTKWFNANAGTTGWIQMRFRRWEHAGNQALHRSQRQRRAWARSEELAVPGFQRRFRLDHARHAEQSGFRQSLPDEHLHGRQSGCVSLLSPQHHGEQRRYRWPPALGVRAVR